MPGWPVVDSIQFARQHGKAEGAVPISDFPRLMQVVSSAQGELKFSLEGYVDADNRPCLQLRVDGAIHVVCQRCLEPLALEIASERRFMLAEQESDLVELADEPDDVESMLADSKLDVLTLVEDEVLLQIPMAPMHAEGSCTRPEWSGDRDKGHPAFSALGALKSKV